MTRQSWAVAVITSPGTFPHAPAGIRQPAVVRDCEHPMAINALDHSAIRAVPYDDYVDENDSLWTDGMMPPVQILSY